MLVAPLIHTTKAALEGDIAVADISCISRPITYDNDEKFKAQISNDGDSGIYVDVKWYLDGVFIKQQSNIYVPANDNSWTPYVTIHWPDDFYYHKVSAKVIISDSNPNNNERNEWFRASLITPITT